MAARSWRACHLAIYAKGKGRSNASVDGANIGLRIPVFFFARHCCVNDMFTSSERPHKTQLWERGILVFMHLRVFFELRSKTVAHIFSSCQIRSDRIMSEQCGSGQIIVCHTCLSVCQCVDFFFGAARLGHMRTWTWYTKCPHFRTVSYTHLTLPTIYSV